jgi:hypothetical protein
VRAAPDSGRTAEQVNWGWLVTTWVVGAALIGAAFALEAAWSWQGVSIDTLVSLGSAILLAGGLYLLQRRLVTEVKVAASEAATAVVDARIDERAREIDTRLDQLDERMRELLGDRNRAQDEAVAALEVPTFDTLASALAVANGLGAIANGHLVVQASQDLAELGLVFSWGYAIGDGRFGIEPGPKLRVQARVYADEQSRGSRPAIETEWLPGVPADAVGLNLHEQLERRGRLKGPGTLDWRLALRNLQRSLDVAIRSRRLDDGDTRLRGALFEFVDADWAVTDAGLECPSKSYLLPETDFEEPPIMPGFTEARAAYDRWLPEPPEWVEPELWHLLIRRAKRYLPIRHGPLSMMPTWAPLTETPEELGLST